MSVHIAPFDWEHSLWVGSYYPADLPPEWRLGYFSNDFDAVLVPAYRWQWAESERLEHWFAEVGDGFSFYWEVDGLDGDALAALPRLIARLAGSSRSLQAGFVVHDVVSIDRYTELASLLRPHGPVCLLEPFAGLSAPGCAETRRADGLSAMGIKDVGEPSVLRRCLEKLVPGVGAEGNGLVVCLGDPPPVECLRTVTTLVHLMGM